MQSYGCNCILIAILFHLLIYRHLQLIFLKENYLYTTNLSQCQQRYIFCEHYSYCEEVKEGQ